MDELSYSLLSDGSSDRALIPILTWLLRFAGVRRAIQPQWADLRHLAKPPRSLADRLRIVIDFYPCDLLFVHRDAERRGLNDRRQEILEALNSVCRLLAVCPPALCVVPVRMMEAWFLLDERAIRIASGNPYGVQPLDLPAVDRIEHLADPKQELRELVRQASELRGRRLRRLPVHDSVHRIAELTRTFEPVRRLPAFASLERELCQLIAARGWSEG